MSLRTIEWRDGVVVTIDQTKLPTQEVYVELKTCEDVAYAIKEMKVRGAPLIGVAAAMGLALTAFRSKARSRQDLMKELEASAKLLRETRPTAVNLFWSIDRVLKKAREVEGDVEEVKRLVVEEAKRMADEDVEVNRRIGRNGLKLIRDGYTVLTHCNAGGLATVGYGTALGVIRAAFEAGRKIKVIATETRPKLQGARLTSYELIRDGIPVTLITDSMAGYAMKRGMVDIAIVGADRIVKDAVINKIGTYTIAVLAKENDVPFYVAAPLSTMDLSRKASEVEIEERDSKEVLFFGPVRIAPEGVNVWNPAFDVTPMEYVKGIITEVGVLSPDELESKLNAG
ncbi:S-methyl-5-thioribose-1-phosphate isomerase [Candidatus Bathyarchaeota archaeon]|nr:MAG: S-methyl-5-thioribose-1-phosphate isomerase [Candidatus Bathyarchaeota archaeon]